MFRFSSHPLRLCTRDLLRPIWLVPGWIALWLVVSVPVDGQVIPQAPTAVATADTSREQVSLGMGVFGTVLGIHGSDSLMVAGDLVLDHADVVGAGALVLKSRQPRRLMSTHSTLTNLVIDNPTQVTLAGDLRVTEHLMVKGGTLVADNGILTLAPACQMQLLAGGQLKTGPIVQPALPVARLSISCSPDGLLCLMPMLPIPVIRAIRQGGATVQDDDQYASLAYSKPVPPPEVSDL